MHIYAHGSRHFVEVVIQNLKRKKSVYLFKSNAHFFHANWQRHNTNVEMQWTWELWDSLTGVFVIVFGFTFHSCSIPIFKNDLGAKEYNVVDSFISKRRRKCFFTMSESFSFQARETFKYAWTGFFLVEKKRSRVACSCKCHSNEVCHINVCGCNISNDSFVRSQSLNHKTRVKIRVKIVSIKYFVTNRRVCIEIPMDLLCHFWSNVEICN